jgi:hypothetical protein
MRTTLTRALVGLGLAGALFLGAGAAVARRPTTPRRARPPRPRRTASTRNGYGTPADCPEGANAQSNSAQSST